MSIICGGQEEEEGSCSLKGVSPRRTLTAHKHYSTTESGRQRSTTTPLGSAWRVVYKINTASGRATWQRSLYRAEPATPGPLPDRNTATLRVAQPTTDSMQSHVFRPSYIVLYVQIHDLP